MKQRTSHSQASRVDPDKILRLVLRMIPFVAGGPEILDIVRDLMNKQTELDTKVARASASLKEASSLIEELDTEMAQRLKISEELQGKYEQYKSLSNLEEKEAEALLKEVEDLLSKGRGKERFVGFILSLIGGLIVFILGVVFGPTIQRLIGIGT